MPCNPNHLPNRKELKSSSSGQSRNNGTNDLLFPVGAFLGLFHFPTFQSSPLIGWNVPSHDGLCNFYATQALSPNSLIRLYEVGLQSVTEAHIKILAGLAANQRLFVLLVNRAADSRFYIVVNAGQRTITMLVIPVPPVPVNHLADENQKDENSRENTISQDYVSSIVDLFASVGIS